MTLDPSSTRIERPKLSDERTVVCCRRHIRREKNPPHFPPAFFRLSSKDGVTAESVTGDRDPSILKVVGILIFDVFFYLTLWNGDSPLGGVGGSKITSDSLAIVMGPLMFSYHLFGSSWNNILRHEHPINDLMSVSHSV